jgi:mono/diheme cytochrome c family protein
MTRRTARNGIATCTVLLCLVLAGDLRSQGQSPAAGVAAPTGPQNAAAAPATPQRALLDQYCVGCHSERLKSGGLALSQLNLDSVGQSADVAEKVIRKLRAGMMPPAGARRPDSKAAADFVTWLETEVDKTASDREPGRVALRRLNRREYAYAIRDLIGLNVDAAALLPQDNVGGHFDNNAAALQVSPSFVDQYISAAREVAIEAVGDPKAPAITTTYGDVANMVISLPPDGAPGTGRQQHHIEGLPRRSLGVGGRVLAQV